ncbi:MAG: site-2 protease family protein [Leptolyngbyaceae cyanobacterium MO_188.B28]|nr:site-2 protease family protein [Leptolyngbyaceae cyanobacterium MO_188.B28]
MSSSEFTPLIFLAAVVILVSGFYRARPHGKLGLLAWFQSVVLMAPWLLFFGLFAVGVYLNLAGILLLIVISVGFYIYLGRQLRIMGQNELNIKRAAPLTDTAKDTESADDASRSIEGEAEEGQETQPPKTSDQEAESPPLLTPIPQEDISLIEDIFGIDSFFRTETIPYQEGVIFRGNLRGSPEATYAKLSATLQAKLGDRYRLMLIESPENKPVVIVLPSSSDPIPTTRTQKFLAAVLGVATLGTCLEASGILMEFDFFQEPGRIQEVIPIALGVIAVLIAHEIGHRILAQRHQVKLSPPFFIPTWQIGSFGALTRFESLLPNRSVLFDIAFAGPAAGGIVSLTLLILGLLLSHPGSFFQIPAEFFQGSILVGALARVVLGSALQQALVDIHPLAVIGWFGLVITAINLMPAGQLDGGRVIQAIYGRKVAGRTTVITLVILAIVSFVNPLALYWAVLILFLQRNLERPSLNEITEPDDTRAALGLLALFLMLATLLPLTPSLAGHLGIGT